MMKATPDCIYCYLKQAINCMHFAHKPEAEQPAVLYEIMDLVRNFSMDETPCYNSTFSILKTYELCGNTDPFVDEKRNSNIQAREILDRFMEHHAGEHPGLYWNIKLCAAGNIIDTGIVVEYDIEKTIEDTMKKGFSIDHYQDFKEDIEKAETILYLADNCGEIVFDTPVVKFLAEKGKKVYLSVKSAPILNDAMYDDAVFAGMDKYAEIVETGSGFLGVSPKDSSEEFINLLNTCDVIISKGQANFESLSDYNQANGNIYFILKIKCDRVADEIKGSKFGDSVFVKSGKGKAL
ncbi:MAG: DUF89 family protein [Clostridia bacterium]|nr:DUF89 family protein [Clostridia bacterium]MBN2884199.1 DUF89 family protein [Clostridia bacterium]